MRIKKFLTMGLAIMLSCSMLTMGCGKKSTESTKAETTKAKSTEAKTDEAENDEEDSSGEDNTEAESIEADISKKVTLTMYCIGDEGGIYADEAIENINNILMEKINAKIEPKMVSWGEYKQKLPLIWASGESYDLTFVADWSGYFTEATKGPFMECEELMEQYAPNYYEELKSTDRLENAKIDGKLYMIPAVIEDWTTHAFVYREDLRKKYDCPEINDEESLEAYLDAIKENEPSMLPLNQNGNERLTTMALNYENDWAYIGNNSSVIAYDIEDGTNVFNLLETDQYRDYVNKMYDWAQRGYWTQSVMAETTGQKDQFNNGKSGCYLAGITAINDTNAKLQPGWEIGVYSVEGDTKVAGVAPTNNGMAIGANSQNPERAMMFLELVHSDKEVYDAVCVGIKDKTYVDNGDGTIGVPEGMDPSTLNLKNLGMGLIYSKYQMGSKSDWSGITELKEDYASRTVVPQLAGLVLNQDNISAEMAAVATVYAEYVLPMEKGMSSDPDVALETAQKKMKEAGIDKIIEEVQKQAEEYLNK